MTPAGHVFFHRVSHPGGDHPPDLPDTGSDSSPGPKSQVSNAKNHNSNVKNFWLSPVQNMSHSGLTGWTIPTPHSLQHLNVGKREIQGPASGAEILARQKGRVTRICPLQAPIALPERNRMSQTRKTMSLTFENANLSPVQHMSHSGLTGWTIPIPNGFQHLNLGNHVGAPSTIVTLEVM